MDTKEGTFPVIVVCLIYPNSISMDYTICHASIFWRLHTAFGMEWARIGDALDVFSVDRVLGVQSQRMTRSYLTFGLFLIINIYPSHMTQQQHISIALGSIQHTISPSRSSQFDKAGMKSAVIKWHAFCSECFGARPACSISLKNR